MQQEENFNITAGEWAKNLILESIPERVDELSSLWDEYGPQFEFLSGKAGFHCEGGPFRLICFNDRALLIFWLLGVAAWKAQHAYGTFLYCAQNSLAENGFF